MARVVLWAVLLYVLWVVARRLIRSMVEGMGYRPPGDDAAVGLVRDPVCGTFVVPTKALTSGSGTNTRYFCSEKCRNDYVRST